MHFCGFSQHYYHFFFLSTWGVILEVGNVQEILHGTKPLKCVRVRGYCIAGSMGKFAIHTSTCKIRVNIAAVSTVRYGKTS